MKIKEELEKNNCHTKNFNGREDFIRLYQEIGWTNFNELQVTDSTLNEGTNSLINEQIAVG